MTTNRFLSSTVGIDSLAQESTLSELNNFIQSGAVQVGGISGVTIDNFPSSQDVVVTNTPDVNVANSTIDVITTNLPFGNADPTPNPGRDGAVVITLADDHLSSNDVNININNLGGNGAPSSNEGTVNDTTLRTVLSNDYKSTTKSNISQVGGDAVSLGQKVMTSCVPVVIAQDQSAIDNTITDVNIPSQSTDLNVFISNKPSNDTGVMNGSYLYFIDDKLTTIRDDTGFISSNTGNSQGYNMQTAATLDYFKLNGITANAGTNTSTASLALESGGNLSNIQTNTSNAASYTSSINSKLPSQGQALSDNSVPVVISSDQTAVPIYMNTIGMSNAVVATQSGNTDAGTQRVVLSNNYESTAYIRNPIEFMTRRRSLLYFNSTVMSGAISHNLAIDLSSKTGATNPQSTSISLLGAGEKYIFAVEVFLQLSTTSNFHNQGYGGNSTQLTGGFGIYYQDTNLGTEIPIVNDVSATNELPLDKIVGNAGLLRAFSDFTLYNTGSGNQSIKFRQTYARPLRIISGGYYFRFTKEDLTINNMSKFYVIVHYMS